MKYWEIEIDGIDRAGKDTLCYYLCKLSNYKFSINVRGIMSQLVYNEKFNRHINYDLADLNKNKIFILLTAEEDDINVRCAQTHEEPYDISGDIKLFDNVYTNMLAKGYKCFSFNTSYTTPYVIAKTIINIINELEENKNKNGEI